MTDKTNISKIKVLMYHRVLEKPSNRNLRGHYVRAGDFIKQLKLIDTLGYTTITFQDYKLYLEDKLTLPKKAIIITFDDGYLDTYALAAPLLIKHNMNAVIFAMGNRELQRAYWEETGEGDICPLMTDEQLRDLHSSGFEIGAHSMNHLDLTSLREEDIYKEIVESKKMVEDIIGDSVHTFAYPFGSVNNRIKKLAEFAGYSFACGVYTGPYRFGEDIYDIRRLAINYHTGTPSYLLRLMFPFQYVEWAYFKTVANRRFKSANPTKKILKEAINFNP